MELITTYLRIIKVFIIFILLSVNTLYELRADIPMQGWERHEERGPMDIMIYMSESVRDPDSVRWFVLTSYMDFLRFDIEKEVFFKTDRSAQFQIYRYSKFGAYLIPIHKSIFANNLELDSLFSQFLKSNDEINYRGEFSIKDFIEKHNISLLPLKSGSTIEFDSDMKTFFISHSRNIKVDNKRGDFDKIILIQTLNNIRFKNQNLEIYSGSFRNLFFIFVMSLGLINYFILKRKRQFII